MLLACDANKQSGQSSTELHTQTPKEVVEIDASNGVEENFAQHASLIFKDYRDDCWHRIELHLEGRVSPVSNPSITCIESYGEQDISPNRNVSLLHVLNKGELDSGDGTTMIEEYACYFINLRTGLLSVGYSDSMCSGEWNASNQWMVSEDERYSISELF